MTQTSSWNELKTVIKGTIGEEIVNKYLIENGYIPYKPDCGGAHPFDKLCASKDKKTIFVAEIKSKARRNYYPDTGIDYRHYEDYKNIKTKYGIDTFLFFVDEMVKKIYGNWLVVLEEPRAVIVREKPCPYPKTELDKRGITTIYFPLDSMLEIGELTEEQSKELIDSSTRKYGYINGTNN